MNRYKALLKAAMWADAMKQISGNVGFGATLPAPGTAEQYRMWEDMADTFRKMAREIRDSEQNAMEAGKGAKNDDRGSSFQNPTILRGQWRGSGDDESMGASERLDHADDQASMGAKSQDGEHTD